MTYVCESVAQRIRRERAERKPAEVLRTIMQLTGEAERKTWESYRNVIDNPSAHGVLWIEAGDESL